MISTTILLQKAWDKLFFSKQALLHMIGLSVIPGLIVLMITGVAAGNKTLLSGYNFQMIFKDLPMSVILLLGILGIMLFIGFILLSLVCSYLSLRVLTNNFKNKKESLPTLLSHWKKSFDYLRLGVATTLYILGWGLLGLLSFFLIYIDTIMVIPALFIFSGILGYAGVNLVFTSGIFFFEDISGFSAIRDSREMIIGRWWKTLGYILVLVAATIFIVLMLGVGEYGGGLLLSSLKGNNLNNGPILEYLVLGLLAIGGILQFIVQIFLKFYYTSYIFTLYQEFKKTPVNK